MSRAQMTTDLTESTIIPIEPTIVSRTQVTPVTPTPTPTPAPKPTPAPTQKSPPTPTPTPTGDTPTPPTPTATTPTSSRKSSGCGCFSKRKSSKTDSQQRLEQAKLESDAEAAKRAALESNGAAAPTNSSASSTSLPKTSSALPPAPPPQINEKKSLPTIITSSKPTVNNAGEASNNTIKSTPSATPAALTVPIPPEPLPVKEPALKSTSHMSAFTGCTDVMSVPGLQQGASHTSALTGCTDVLSVPGLQQQSAKHTHSHHHHHHGDAAPRQQTSCLTGCTDTCTIEESMLSLALATDNDAAGRQNTTAVTIKANKTVRITGPPLAASGVVRNVPQPSANTTTTPRQQLTVADAIGPTQEQINSGGETLSYKSSGTIGLDEQEALAVPETHPSTSRMNKAPRPNGEDRAPVDMSKPFYSAASKTNIVSMVVSNDNDAADAQSKKEFCDGNTCTSYRANLLCIPKKMNSPSLKLIHTASSNVIIDPQRRRFRPPPPKHNVHIPVFVNASTNMLSSSQDSTFSSTNTFSPQADRRFSSSRQLAAVENSSIFPSNTLLSPAANSEKMISTFPGSQQQQQPKSENIAASRKFNIHPSHTTTSSRATAATRHAVGISIVPTDDADGTSINKNNMAFRPTNSAATSSTRENPSFSVSATIENMTAAELCRRFTQFMRAAVEEASQSQERQTTAAISHTITHESATTRRASQKKSKLYFLPHQNSSTVFVSSAANHDDDKHHRQLLVQDAAVSSAAAAIYSGSNKNKQTLLSSRTDQSQHTDHDDPVQYFKNEKNLRKIQKHNRQDSRRTSSTSADSDIIKMHYADFESTSGLVVVKDEGNNVQRVRNAIKPNVHKNLNFESPQVRRTSGTSTDTEILKLLYVDSESTLAKNDDARVQQEKNLHEHSSYTHKNLKQTSSRQQQVRRTSGSSTDTEILKMLYVSDDDDESMSANIPAAAEDPRTRNKMSKQHTHSGDNNNNNTARRQQARKTRTSCTSTDTDIVKMMYVDDDTATANYTLGAAEDDGDRVQKRRQNPPEQHSTYHFSSNSKQLTRSQQQTRRLSGTSTDTEILNMMYVDNPRLVNNIISAEDDDDEHIEKEEDSDEQHYDDDDDQNSRQITRKTKSTATHHTNENEKFLHTNNFLSSNLPDSFSKNEVDAKNDARSNIKAAAKAVNSVVQNFNNKKPKMKFYYTTHIVYRALPVDARGRVRLVRQPPAIARTCMLSNCRSYGVMKKTMSKPSLSSLLRPSTTTFNTTAIDDVVVVVAAERNIVSEKKKKVAVTVG